MVWSRDLRGQLALSRRGRFDTIRAADTSRQMLAIASTRLGAHDREVSLERLDLESMPAVPESSIDAYSISLGLKICDRSHALREAYRVLRPGGRLIALEASNIPWPAVNTAYLWYMALCMPILGWIASGGDSSAYRLSLGIVAIHSATKRRVE